MDAKQIIKEYDTSKKDRSTLESSWEEIHRYFLAVGDEVRDEKSETGKLDRKAQYTDTPTLSLNVLTAGLHSYLTSPTGDWFQLRPKDSKLATKTSVKKFLEEVEDVVRDAIALTNFDTEQDDFYNSSAAYGSACMLIEEDEEADLRFDTIPIKNVYWQEDAKGRVNKFYIEHNLTASQAVGRFGNKTPEDIQNAAKKDGADATKYKFIQYVGPRSVRDVAKKDNKNMPVMMKWIHYDGQVTVKEGGMMELPFAYHRFYKRVNSPYGYSPCMNTMKSVKKLNETLMFSLRAMSTAIDGPLDIPHNGYVGKLNLGPRGLNYRRGDQKIEQIRTNTQLGYVDYLVNYYEDLIKQGLFNDAITTLGGISKRMNDLEVSELIAEKMVLLGPAVGRYLEEFAANVIRRSIAILARRGKLPQPPEELGAGFEYKIEFISPLAKAQRNNELQAIRIVLATAGEVAQVKPTVLDYLDEDAIIKEVGDIAGATLKIFHTDAEVESVRKDRAKREEANRAIEQSRLVLEGQKQEQEIANGNKTGG